MQSCVLLTGGTGFLGKVVLETLLRRRDEFGLSRVLLLVRAADAEVAEKRLRGQVFASPCFSRLPPGWQEGVEALPGDLVREGLGLCGEDRQRVAREVTHVIHCAASIDFDLPLPEAARVNALGALQVLELARSCPRLARLVSVSTAYVTPHPGHGRALPVEEELAPLRGPLAGDPERLLAECLEGSERAQQTLRESGHPNTYTFTKCLAEHLLVARCGDVPLALVRPSIISVSRAHPFPGWIDSQAAFAAFVALLGTGQLRAVAAEPEARIDLVPVDEVADRVVRAAMLPPPASPGIGPAIVHAVAGREGNASVELCRRVILGFFSRYRAGRGPQLRHVGPAGPVFALRAALHQQLPVRAAALMEGLRGRHRQRAGLLAAAERLEKLVRSFAYFTHRSFDFHSSDPMDADFDPERYLREVCRGVHDHLLRLDSRETPLGERGSWAARRLARAGARVSFDLDSFDAARPAIDAAPRVWLIPSRSGRMNRRVLRALILERPDLGLRGALVPAAPLDAALLRRCQQEAPRTCVLPIGIGGDPEAGRFHLVCGRPVAVAPGAEAGALAEEIAREISRATPEPGRGRRRRKLARADRSA